MGKKIHLIVLWSLTLMSCFMIFKEMPLLQSIAAAILLLYLSIIITIQTIMVNN